LWLGVSEAKVAYISLDELVQEADLVLYGQTTQHTGTPSKTVAWMKPLAVLKNKKAVATGKDVPVCNGGDTESVDFNAYPGSYVVFVSKEGDCYSPIAGIRSVVLIRDQVALTARIQGQPERQTLDAFLKEIRALVGSQ
jgi:hypothetical protein